jgi:mycofactocin precursor
MPTPSAPLPTEAAPIATDLSTATEETEPGPQPSLVADDVLVEDVSIDGMCGVY